MQILQDSCSHLSAVIGRKLLRPPSGLHLMALPRAAPPMPPSHSKCTHPCHSPLSSDLPTPSARHGGRHLVINFLRFAFNLLEAHNSTSFDNTTTYKTGIHGHRHTTTNKDTDKTTERRAWALSANLHTRPPIIEKNVPSI